MDGQQRAVSLDRSPGTWNVIGGPQRSHRNAKRSLRVVRAQRRRNVDHGERGGVKLVGEIQVHVGIFGVCTTKISAFCKGERRGAMVKRTPLDDWRQAHHKFWPTSC